jgi:hypothetical protein
MRIQCGGPKAACDRLSAEFKKLNSEMKKSLQAR